MSEGVKSVMLVLAMMVSAVVLAQAGVANERGVRELDPTTLHYTFLPMTKGVVEAIDWRSGEITVSHERIYDVNLNPGTSEFRVADPALLERFVPGDPIYLVADRIANKLTILSLQARHPE